MKKLFTLSIIAVLFAASAFSQTWTVQQSNTTQNLWSVVFISNNVGFACGTGGTILKTTNSGTNWVAKSSGTTNDLKFLQFINATTGICASLRGPLMRTTDAGESWSVISFGNMPAANSLGGGWFSDINNGVIAYGTSSYTQSKILRTMNGGSSWDTVHAPISVNPGWISYMHFPDDMHGYASVAYGAVYRTSNRGFTWSTLYLPGAMPQLWTSGVYFLNSVTGFVGGGEYSTMTGQIFKTTNGGLNWQLITNLYGIAKLQFADNTNGYGLAANNTAGNGILIKTVDGGNNWSVFSTPMDSLNGMHFLNSTLGYAVGVRGRILRYGFPIGINNISSEIPDNYSLHQNFPNPFNPETKIKFSIMSNKHGFGGDLVQLMVCDINGRIIQTLVNEVLISGTYEVTFDASALNSGVYFYKISAGDFHETKRMLFVK